MNTRYFAEFEGIPTNPLKFSTNSFLEPIIVPKTKKTADSSSKSECLQFLLC